MTAPAPPPATADDGHLAYLERLLEAARAPGSSGEFLYVTRTEGQPGFWELLGFRVTGMSRALLGAVHFQPQTDDPLLFARRSMAHFLSSPPQTLGIDRATYPADLLDLRVPQAGQTVPDLLGRLKRGEPAATVYLDAAHVEIACDFRPENPSLMREQKGEAGKRLLFRSREGHVLSGVTANLSTRLRRAGAFIALTEVEQVLDGRTLALPTLLVHREFLTMLADAPAAGIAPGAVPAAFSPATANPFHLLDPRLDTGAPETGRPGPP